MACFRLHAGRGLQPARRRHILSLQAWPSTCFASRACSALKSNHKQSPVAETSTILCRLRPPYNSHIIMYIQLHYWGTARGWGGSSQTIIFMEPICGNSLSSCNQPEVRNCATKTPCQVLPALLQDSKRQPPKTRLSDDSYAAVWTCGKQDERLCAWVGSFSPLPATFGDHL